MPRRLRALGKPASTAPAPTAASAVQAREKSWTGVSTLKVNQHKVGPGQPVLLVEQYCQPICYTRRVFISVLHVRTCPLGGEGKGRAHLSHRRVLDALIDRVSPLLFSAESWNRIDSPLASCGVGGIFGDARAWVRGSPARPLHGVGVRSHGGLTPTSSP